MHLGGDFCNGRRSSPRPRSRELLQRVLGIPLCGLYEMRMYRVVVVG